MPPIIQQKTCAFGAGFFASECIPEGTVVLREKPFMLPTTEASTARTMFRLIDRVLRADDKTRDAFLRFVPHAVDAHSVPYESIAREHLELCPHLTKHEAVLYATKYVRNAFHTRAGPALLFQGQIFNHSCSPNTRFALEEAKDAKAKEMVFRTCRPVQKGEQLFDCYGHNPALKKQAAHRKLLSQYGFACRC